MLMGWSAGVSCLIWHWIHGIIGPNIGQNFDVSNDISWYVIELHNAVHGDAASAPMATPVLGGAMELSLCSYM